MRLIDNQAYNKLFDNFNDLYGNSIVDICSEINNIHIVSYNLQNYNRLHPNNTIDYCKYNDTPYAFISKGKDIFISDPMFEILRNDEMCDKLGLSTTEEYACIGHEIGHLLVELHTDYCNFSSSIKEVFADEYACLIGLKSELLSVLSKLYSSNICSNEQKRVLQIRINYMKNYE